MSVSNISYSFCGVGACKGVHDLEDEEDKTGVEQIAKIVAEILTFGAPSVEPGRVSLSSLESDSCVYCLPKDRIVVWGKKALEREALPTAIFWTLFEQLNIRDADQFQSITNQFVSGSIDLDKAVEDFEKVEYMNALEAKSLMLQAVTRKVVEASNEQFNVVPADFRTHYLFQQFQGHAQRIAERLSVAGSQPYKGTWRLDLSVLSRLERKQIEELFHLKAQVSDISMRNKALLKLGCNLVYVERIAKADEKPFLLEAVEELFSSEEITDAKNQATKYLQRDKPEEPSV